MNKVILKKIFFISIFFMMLTTAHAYIGPGMSGGVIAATIGVIVAIIAALFGLIWFPMKRLLKRRKEKTVLKDNKLNDEKQ